MKNRNELIANFFDSKAEIYDEVHPKHLLGGLQSKIDTVKYIPETAVKILDLGAGTGLELKYIFEKNKNAIIDCVDVSKKMLEKLKEKYPEEKVNIFLKDYYKFKYVKSKYNCVFSIMSLHHFTPKDKLKLYRLIVKTLNPSGAFVYGDYCAKDLNEEIFFQSELKRLIKEKSPEVWSYDVPTHPETDIKLLKKAGFSNVEIKWQTESNVCIVANK